MSMYPHVSQFETRRLERDRKLRLQRELHLPAAPRRSSTFVRLGRALRLRPRPALAEDC
jgi:hypothetical protein